MSSYELLPQERLDAIREREAKATAGPWAIDGPAQCGPGDTLTVYPVEDGGALAYVQPSWDDADFIAHARTDVPALLAEVERLRARPIVDDAMVERAAIPFVILEYIGRYGPVTEEEVTDHVAARMADQKIWQALIGNMRAALDAAHGTKEES